MTEGVATFSERIFPVFEELFSIDPTRNVRAGAPDKRSVNPQLSNLRMPRLSALETTMLPTRLQQCPLLIPLFNPSVFIS
jgi:hypothetical protein